MSATVSTSISNLTNQAQSLTFASNLSSAFDLLYDRHTVPWLVGRAEDPRLSLRSTVYVEVHIPDLVSVPTRACVLSTTWRPWSWKEVCL
jgi:hypothetical protein